MWSKAGNDYFYMLDELGTGMYLTGTDGNIIQPFAFTGYQEDEVSGLKFAQARFYSAENGRFVGEDQVRGFIETPETQNSYEYCWNSPFSYYDMNGKFPTVPSIPSISSKESKILNYGEKALDIGVKGTNKIISTVQNGINEIKKSAAENTTIIKKTINDNKDVICNTVYSVACLEAISVCPMAFSYIATRTVADITNSSFAVGASATLGANYFGVGSVQYGYGNGVHEIQAGGGFNIGTGEKAGLVATASFFPGIKDIHDTEKFGYSIGGSIGFGYLFGADFLFCDDDFMGITFSIGLGEGIEAHVGESYLMNIWQFDEKGFNKGGNCNNE
ncbi:RHS repeat-associated core domain-containing protein [Pseudobutyrivibrio sp. YE44]|uniref:RHS repeat-associated core domain-containing protein n=1 Tax=Pseudobutyrivibrio sp. YE44 TaxID=1520802 RepID=UPI00088EF504|nr:RHS repeat-associated core domain-containing protein [Pseudobutyrivibrio sp. YE44]SDB29796.1 RHS repeat-associated core domain-containing protein [Pseudobutyrivibrio sp. YE44]